MSNINLGIRYLHSQTGERLDHRGQTRKTRRFPHNHVSLKSNSINLDTTSKKTGDEVASCCCFGSIVFEIVIIVIQFDVRIVECCCFESNGDKFGSDLLG